MGYKKIFWEETEKQKARRCPAKEFGPKQCPEKMSSRKTWPTELRNNGHVEHVEMDPDVSDLKNGSKPQISRNCCLG